ncbi:MAG: hypothetical protein CSA65_04290 [Proteobacteria bacterium]|nr:MAG: hypothetical protein CSA65_04290 [Pseudomonadota bacterium]
MLGSTAWVPEGGRYLHNQRIGLFVDVNERRLNPGFLYHLMNSAIVRQQIQATATGTKVKHTAPKRIGAVRVSLPPLDVQRRIADILSAYDQLIENNDRRMDLLEASIHLLYREWFVYLRLPGHERMEIVDGVPSGWRRATVGSVLARAPTRRKVPKNEYQQSGTIPTVDQSRDFIGGYTDDISALYTAEHLPLVVFGDHTRILKFVDFPFARGADGTQVLSPAPGAITPHFLYFALSAVDLSGFGHARHFKHLKAEEILVPTPPTVVAFDEIAQPALKQVSILREQNQQLREARDLLLPRLMDGRIRV